MTYRPPMTAEDHRDQLFSQVFANPEGKRLIAMFNNRGAIPISEIERRIARCRERWSGKSEGAP